MAVITIGEGYLPAGRQVPSDACIHANAHAMARYAALCQEAGIVPVVEPEVIIDGDHTIERSYEVTAATLKKTFEELAGQDVALEGAILKASMVIAGKKAAKQSTPKEVAEMTVKCLMENVPANLAGVVFLSGGQGDEQAAENLDEMNKLGHSTSLTASKAPWPLTFSYSRAIQNPVLKLWAENPSANIASAQETLLFRSRMCSLASLGKYSSEMEKQRPY
jgi:fructose-bisphosphate aldolase class I